MSAHLVDLAEALMAARSADDVPGAARLLQRLEYRCAGDGGNALRIDRKLKARIVAWWLNRKRGLRNSNNSDATYTSSSFFARARESASTSVILPSVKR